MPFSLGEFGTLMPHHTTHSTLTGVFAEELLHFQSIGEHTGRHACECDHTAQRSAAHRTTAHRTAPHHTAPHHSTPHRTAPHHATVQAAIGKLDGERLMLITLTWLLLLIMNINAGPPTSCHHCYCMGGEAMALWVPQKTLAVVAAGGYATAFWLFSEFTHGGCYGGAMVDWFSNHTDACQPVYYSYGI